METTRAEHRTGRVTNDMTVCGSFILVLLSTEVASPNTLLPTEPSLVCGSLSATSNGLLRTRQSQFRQLRLDVKGAGLAPEGLLQGLCAFTSLRLWLPAHSPSLEKPSGAPPGSLQP